MRTILLHWFDILEILLVALAWLVAKRRPDFASAQFEAAEAWLTKWGERRALAILLSAAVPMLIRLLLLPVMPIPAPLIHDEFSHILAGDTLARGRAANPPDPHWEFFESFHVLHHPTYASMEPPAPGLFLAAGQRLFGDPWYGVWLGMGLVCGALCWALQEWFPAPWAFAGALLAGVRWGVLSYWMNSYWGGSAAAFGGALVLGGAASIARRPAAAPALLLGLGWSILAASRPLEGLLISIPVAIYIAMNFFRSRARGAFFMKAILPAGLVLASGIGALLAYNARITGSPLRMPNQVNRQEYAVAPYFIWEPLHTAPLYRHEVMRRFYSEFEAESVIHARAHPVSRALQISDAYRAFYFGFALLVPLAVALRRWRAPGSALIAAVIAIPWLSQIVSNTGFLAHYHAPVLGAVLVLIVSGLRSLRNGGPEDLFLSRAIPAICAAMFLLAVPFQLLDALQSNPPLYAWYAKSLENRPRAAIVDSLNSTGGKHLIFVSYAANHQTIAEWVYNGADIPNAPIVWARDMGPEKNAALIRDSGGRIVWRIEPDRNPADLIPYNSKPPLLP